jgi:hypothetical protein
MKIGHEVAELAFNQNQEKMVRSFSSEPWKSRRRFPRGVESLRLAFHTPAFPWLTRVAATSLFLARAKSVQLWR